MERVKGHGVSLMLELDKINVRYGAIHALKDLSITAAAGEIVALIGGNGAGKSSTLNAICGIVPVTGGRIILAGEETGRLKPHEIVKRGISQVPEGRRVFGRMTVLENLELGGYTCPDRAAVREGIERAFTMFPRLAERKGQLARTLSGGEQQMLAMARALMSNPRILLLDEPSMGLAPILVEKIFEMIQEINREGCPIILVEQNAAMALSISHRGYLLETGKVVLSGNSRELEGNTGVRRAYLGE